MLEDNQPLFSGAASEIITPFTETGQVDLAALSNEIAFLISKGITGLFINGLASEALMMSDQDRVLAAKTIIDTNANQIPIMGNIIRNSTAEALKDVEAYASLGANAIAITPPLIYKFTEGGLFDYFNSIASASPLPVYIYNAPETGNKLSPKLVAKLFVSNEAFFGYKDSTQNIIELQTLLSLIPSGRRFELMAGSDAQISTTMMLGGLGVISLITVVFPELIVELVDACKRKDWGYATELQFKVLKVREALKTGPFMSAYKFVSAELGRPLGCMKHSLSEVNDKEKEAIKSQLADLNML